MDLFEVKVKYQPCGKQDEVTETYLVDAMSFTEAEAKIIENLACYSNNDIQILTERKSSIKEVLNIEGYTEKSAWYRGKLSALVDIENERWSSIYYFIKAEGFRDALNRLEAVGNTMTSDVYVVGLRETTIIDLIK